MRFYINHAVKIICLFFFLWLTEGTAVQALTSASIVICAETSTVYHEHNADKTIPPASLTKMMTLYLTFKALQEGKLFADQALPVSKLAAQQDPCKLGLKPGTTLTVRHAILGLVTKSANDAAVVLAEALGGSEADFANMMTQQARKLGMTKTIFKNASGLPHKKQITTAREMAILSHTLYKHFPKASKVFQEQKFVYKGKVHANHNHLLGKVKGVDGIKTGFTNASGFNLAASMVRDNRRIIAVVLGGESIKARDKKMVQLLETTYANLKAKKRFQNETEYDCIEDLIFALSPSEERSNAPSVKKEKLLKAVYLSNTGHVKTLEAKYKTVDALLEGIEHELPQKKLTIQKKPNKKKASTEKKPVGKKTSGKKKSIQEKPVVRKERTTKNIKKIPKKKNPVKRAR